MSLTFPLHLFDAFGIELEYMLVDADTLDVRPIADRLLRDERGNVQSDVEHGPLCWSNELTHHVIELKTNGPAPDLAPLADEFQQQVMAINRLLAAEGARLLPTGMHPWMDPRREMNLWPHDYHIVYKTFDKIFDCRGHGWANLQSMHINLPFAGDEEFGRLHAAIRLVLPILPGLAASSPIVEGRLTGMLDSRLDVYRKNAKGFASITGRVIPEPVYDEASYNREIFQPMFRDIAPHDPNGMLRNEFLNARGAIARFSRGAIEIRVIDVQECPTADLAVASLTVAVLQLLVQEHWRTTEEQQAATIDALEPILLAGIHEADQAVILDRSYLSHFGYSERSATVRDLWRHLGEQVDAARRPLSPPRPDAQSRALGVILEQGCLARRIVQALDGSSGLADVRDVYRQLADCLATGEPFRVR